MPIVLTESSTFTATVSVPASADARTAASVQAPFQALTDRTRDLKDRADAVDIEIAQIGVFAEYSLAGTSVAAGTPYTLAEIRDPSAAFAITADAVQVPAAGTYLVTVHARIANANGTLGILWNTEIKSGAAVVATFGHRRFSNVVGEDAPMGCSCIVVVATPASERISVSGVGYTTSIITLGGNVESRMHIVRLS